MKSNQRYNFECLFIFVIPRRRSHSKDQFRRSYWFDKAFQRMFKSFMGHTLIRKLFNFRFSHDYSDYISLKLICLYASKLLNSVAVYFCSILYFNLLYWTVFFRFRIQILVCAKWELFQSPNINDKYFYSFQFEIINFEKCGNNVCYMKILKGLFCCDVEHDGTSETSRLRKK